MENFLTTFIEKFYRLFDTYGREELHACYHESCMFSLCITTLDNSILPIRQYKYGELISQSRNLQKVFDDNRRINLLRQGKMAVIEFFREKFPATEHDGNSFHVDVISINNNRAVFTVNGLYKEVDQSTNSPVRCFQRTFTCAQTVNGILIIADHILLTNATEAQISNMNRPSSQTTTNTNSNADIENQLVIRFSQQSGMNIEYSRLCLKDNNWNYNKAAEVFLDLQNKNQIPLAAFNKS
jgi:nuclear RNA export factor